MEYSQNIFVEYGLDFDNHRYGFGCSIEIEYPDGTEKRTSEKVYLDKIISTYIRIWIGKYVVVLDSKTPRFSLKHKNRANLKIVLGIYGRSTQNLNVLL